MDANLPGLFLFNFETTPCKNYSDTNLVKIHLAVIEILSFSCSVLFLVTANGSHLGIPNCKKNITASYKKHSGTKLDQWVLRYCHFSVYAIFFGNSPWWPPWMVNLHKYEIGPFRDHCDQI